jgi:hypothetical protein
VHQPQVALDHSLLSLQIASLDPLRADDLRTAESSLTGDPRRHQPCVSLAPIYWLGVGIVVSEPASRALRDLPALRRHELRRSDLARSWRPVPKL